MNGDDFNKESTVGSNSSGCGILHEHCLDQGYSQERRIMTQKQNEINTEAAREKKTRIGCPVVTPTPTPTHNSLVLCRVIAIRRNVSAR